MSLDARNMTQGGQVIKYMVAMFMQIANIVAFWVILVTILVFFATIAFQIPFEKMIHGLSYWAMDTLVIPLQEAIGTSEATVLNDIFMEQGYDTTHPILRSF